MIYVFRGLTALHASSEEVAAWVDKDNPEKIDGYKHRNDVEKRLLQSHEATSSGSSPDSVLSKAKPGMQPKYSFICECFFMTARVLNLGLLKAFSDFRNLVQVRIEDLSTMRRFLLLWFVLQFSMSLKHPPPCLHCRIWMSACGVVNTPAGENFTCF